MVSLESGYIKAASDNLPKVDIEMVNNFFVNNLEFLSAEVLNVKTKRSAVGTYENNAFTYVQLKRDSSICSVKARITPEHKIRSTSYRVQAIINEDAEEVEVCEGLDCPASEGGCKHGVAFLLWLHRRSEEPSVTSTECYWKRSQLSEVVDSDKNITELCEKKAPNLSIKNPKFLSDLLKLCPKSEGTLFSFSKESKFVSTSIFEIMLNFLKLDGVEKNAEEFVVYASSIMTEDTCKMAQEATINQSDPPDWFELRFGRITASVLYEASRCKTLSGALSEKILGAVPALYNEAVTRGKTLEIQVVEEVAKKKHLQILKAGLFLLKQYPLFGASPDGITDEYVIEVKCPAKEKSVERYIRKGKITEKFFYQIQTQMLFANRSKGLFCVALPNFETDRGIEILEIEFEKEKLLETMEMAEQFWKNAIFPALTN